uniref:B30.2/SPRY domain-containing protein n=1 Tax=Salvator merianae TaxID=96440 RepID=A0A8D0BY60_SALMN
FWIPYIKKTTAYSQGLHVTLDQETAHHCLSVSENQRSVTLGEHFQSLPSDPERFDVMSCVLGWEKFTAGRHYWDVEIEGTRVGWAVGVARESVRRKGDINFSPEEGIWAVQYFSNLQSPLLQLTLSRSFSQSFISSLYLLRKVRVSLDYEVGRVEFSDPGSGSSLFTFSSACFTGQRVCPFFWLSTSEPKG